MKKGFTLIETLVAITVLTIAIVGPMSLAISSINSVKIVKNQVIAFYLAQEGIEYVRNLRDNNFIQGNTGTKWLDRLENCWIGSGKCVIDVSRNTITNCGAQCPVIKYDDAGGFYYNYKSGTDTIFIRTVKIDRINIGGGNNEAKIEVIVEWPERFGTKSFTLQDSIFNWK